MFKQNVAKCNSAYSSGLGACQLTLKQAYDSLSPANNEETRRLGLLSVLELEEEIFGQSAPRLTKPDSRVKATSGVFNPPHEASQAKRPHSLKLLLSAGVIAAAIWGVKESGQLIERAEQKQSEPVSNANETPRYALDYIQKVETRNTARSLSSSAAPAFTGEALTPGGSGGVPVSILKGIYFQSNSAAILPEATEAIEKAAQAIIQGGCQHMVVMGYTDNTGAIDYNYNLSFERARSVVEALKSQGVPAAFMSYEGHGSDIPLRGIPYDDGRQRRVELRCE